MADRLKGALPRIMAIPPITPPPPLTETEKARFEAAAAERDRAQEREGQEE